MHYVGISTYQFIPYYASAIHKHTHTRILKPFEDSEQTGPKVHRAHFFCLLSLSLTYLKNAADCSNSSPRLSRKAPLALYSSFKPLSTLFNCRSTKVVSRSNRSMKGVTSLAMDDTTDVYLKTSSSRKIFEACRRACFVCSS